MSIVEKNLFKNKKAAIHNLGCKVNSYEADAMQEALTAAGFLMVPFSETADVYVVNTCTVTNVADRKSRQMLHRARRNNPDAVIVAAGCYVQVADEEQIKEMGIDLVIGNNKKHELIPCLEKIFNDRTEEADAKIDINDGACEYEELSVSGPTGHTRAFIKVQDGCNQFCTYCIIPYARGRIRSRGIESVEEECRQLAECGFREVVLNGIHLSSYGKDIGSSLLELIGRVHAIEGIDRIRLGSLEPRLITQEFVRKLAAYEKVCPHFHLSLQSGSATVLKRMNRHYTPEEYLEKCQILREHYEHPAITTDIIVGFPGETEEEFEETLAFAKEAGFYEIHVFPYSRRNGTPAAKMDGQIPEKIKHERAKRLISCAEDLKRSFENWYEGRRVSVLFEEQKEQNGRVFCEGFTPEYVRVREETKENLQNQIVSVEFSNRLY